MDEKNNKITNENQNVKKARRPYVRKNQKNEVKKENNNIKSARQGKIKNNKQEEIKQSEKSFIKFDNIFGKN